MLKTRSELNRTKHVAEKLGLYQQLVFKQLSKMNLGSLKLILPDGYTIFFGNGINPISACITITHTDFFKKLILFGDIGFGEAYVEGLWQTDNITNVISWVLLNVENAPNVSGSKTQLLRTTFYASGTASRIIRGPIHWPVHGKIYQNITI